MKVFLPLILIFASFLPPPIYGLDSPTASPSATPSPAASPLPEPLTPPAGPAPRINGPTIFGVRPGSPFFYAVPATGDRPMSFAATGLPEGLRIDAATGRITGTVNHPGTFPVTLKARNAVGSAVRPLRIAVGEEIALTPPMGWNSWNCWGPGINEERLRQAAQGFIKFGLDQHGWTYVNMDDGWQGKRGGPFHALQPDPKRFTTDLPRLVEQIHAMGLKVGLYSTPWVTSYDGKAGGSSENPEGTWDSATMIKGTKNKKELPYAIAPYHFATNDAKQWAAWGMDYLKYDWDPVEVPETKEMYDALRASGRDMVLSLSNNGSNTLFAGIGEVSKYANSWRIGGDIGDSWGSIKGHGFGQDRWVPYARPGHWNDPDMLEVGTNGGGKPKRLTADEQYTHVSMWCLVSAPLLLGCDLEHLDKFTVGLLTNDEVLAVDQDALGKQATQIASEHDHDVYAKLLEDGSWAVGLFNRGEAEAEVTVRWGALKLADKQTVRDLWRQKTLGVFEEKFAATVPAHGVVLVRVFKP